MEKNRATGGVLAYQYGDALRPHKKTEILSPRPAGHPMLTGLHWPLLFVYLGLATSDAVQFPCWEPGIPEQEPSHPCSGPHCGATSAVRQ
jgi:hypothetical protein